MKEKNIYKWKRMIIISFVLYIFTWNYGWASPIKYIGYHFENGSPLFWEIREDGAALVSLMYDHERNSANRSAGHWHFQVFAQRGSKVKLILQNFHNIYNGKPANPIRGNPTCYISVDGKDWEVIETDKTPENRLTVEFIMTADSVFVARLEPYRVSDLDRLKAEIEEHPLVEITKIGRTVEGRPLEIIRIGNLNAPNRILLRGRAHPWEPGGNWVIEGLVKNLLKNDPKITKYLDNYCVYILPMTNKDGVAHGRTRFNLRGMDLNRNWDKKAGLYLSPENHALENWLIRQAESGLKPDLAIDFHNDAEGRIHISRPNVNLENYLSNMKILEELLKEHSWFTEGSTGSEFRNPGTFGEGLLERYGIDALIFELNANWIAGLDKAPLGKDWMLLGEQLCDVFYAYFLKVERKSKNLR